MIRKSVETRDWLSTIEPRNVRAVMKRVVEDITAIDAEVGSLYEEGSRKAHSSGMQEPARSSHALTSQSSTVQVKSLSNFGSLFTSFSIRNVIVN